MHNELLAPLRQAGSDSHLDRTVNRFTRIAARLCAVPTARLRFALPHHAEATTPLEDALYALTLAQPSLILVPDVCVENPFLPPFHPAAEAPFRFYAGVPLQTAEGHVLGVLYVVDYAPRTLSDADQEALLALGQAATEQIALQQSCCPPVPQIPVPVSQFPDTAFVSDQCTISIDHEGVIQDWHPAAEAIFGYPHAQAMGRILADLIIPVRLRESHRRGMAHYLSTGNGPVLHRHTQVMALCADGREIPVELVVVPMPTAPGQPPAFTGYIRDISARQMARTALQNVYEDLVCNHGMLPSKVRQPPQAEAAIARLNKSLRDVNQELSRAYDTTIEGWARALDLRDKETEGHSRRVTEVAVQLGRRLGMCPHEQLHLWRGALLHDIGKMGVPDRILLKPGPLDEEEWAIMRRHPEYARDMLAPIEFLRPALDIPYCHHEKWDGTGYPQGLRGEEIPFAARIFSVVDVWDALRSDRPYRPAWDCGRVHRYLAEQAGHAFDPHITRVFLSMLASEGIRSL